MAGKYTKISSNYKFDDFWNKGVAGDDGRYGEKLDNMDMFEEVGANRIESQHDPDNPNSGLVMKKCGLTYEGTLRQADYSNRGIDDACIYSLLKEEWIK